MHLLFVEPRDEYNNICRYSAVDDPTKVNEYTTTYLNLAVLYPRPNHFLPGEDDNMVIETPLKASAEFGAKTIDDFHLHIYLAYFLEDTVDPKT